MDPWELFCVAFCLDEMFVSVSEIQDKGWQESIAISLYMQARATKVGSFESENVIWIPGSCFLQSYHTYLVCVDNFLAGRSQKHCEDVLDPWGVHRVGAQQRREHSLFSPIPARIGVSYMSPGPIFSGTPRHPPTTKNSGPEPKLKHVKEARKGNGWPSKLNGPIRGTDRFLIVENAVKSAPVPLTALNVRGSRGSPKIWPK